MISTDRLLPGVSALMHECIVPPTNVLLIAGSVNPFLHCHRLLPGNALRRKNARVSWDGYLSYDGVLSGLPSEPPLAGTVVQVREQRGVLSIWSRGQSIISLAKRPHSQDIVDHPDQFRTVASANASRLAVVPLGHQHSAPHIVQRPLQEYDQLCGVEVVRCNTV